MTDTKKLIGYVREIAAESFDIDKDILNEAADKLALLDTAPAPAMVCVCGMPREKHSAGEGRCPDPQGGWLYARQYTPSAPAISGGETPENVARAMYDAVRDTRYHGDGKPWDERSPETQAEWLAAARRFIALAAADRSATPPTSGKTQHEVFRAEGEEA